MTPMVFSSYELFKLQFQTSRQGVHKFAVVAQLVCHYQLSPRLEISPTQ